MFSELKRQLPDTTTRDGTTSGNEQTLKGTTTTVQSNTASTSTDSAVKCEPATQEIIMGSINADEKTLQTLMTNEQLKGRSDTISTGKDDRSLHKPSVSTRDGRHKTNKDEVDIPLPPAVI